MLKKNIDRYNDFWGVDNIEIRKIYPVSEDVECTTVNYPNCNIIKIRGGNLSFEYSNFVVLCRKENVEGIIENKCDLAKIMVSYG